MQRALLDDDIGLPQDERAASVRVAEGPPEALWLGDGAQLSARFRSPQSGRLQRLGLRVATGRRVLAGMLRLQVCTDHCVTATASLGGARDGGDLLFAFAEPLELAAGRPVQVELEAAVQGPPVALWLHPADPGAAPLRVRDSQGERQVPARSPRFTLGLRR